MLALKSKTPKLLYSYLAAEMLAPFFASFLIINCVFFLVRLIPFLNFVLDLNIGLADFTRLFSYLFPHIFLYSIPMASMMGVTIAFARLSSDSEIVAFKASGISMYRIIPPVVIVTGLIALLTAYFSIQIIPRTEVAMKQLTYQLVKEKINKGIKEHEFTEALGDVVVYVDKIDKNTGLWVDVWVSDMRGVKNPVITMASTGEMISSVEDMMVSIILRDGSLHRPNNASTQIVQFENYRINIPLNPPKTKRTQTKKRSVLNMGELLEEAEKMDTDSRSKKKFLIEFHKRLVLPAGCLLISLIGLPLGLQAKPGRKAIGIQTALAIFILYYILFTLGKSTAESGTFPVALSMWTPNVLFFFLAVFWIYRVSNEMSLIPNFLSTFFYFLKSSIIRTTKKYAQKLVLKFGEKQGIGLDPTLSDGIDTDLHLIQGNAKSRVFHVPSCEYYNCRNCTITFKDVDVALESGFEPCRFCKDFIDP